MDTKRLYRKYVMTGFVRAVESVVIARGQGAEIIAQDGRRYLDAFAGIAVTNCGHGNPEILAAAARQLRQFVHCCSYLYYSPPTALLAQRLAEITPGRGAKKVFFGNSGAEANEAALRLAKRYTGRREFIALQGAFHGRSYATLSISGQSSRKRGGGPYMGGVAFAPIPYCYRCPFGLRAPSCAMRCAEAVQHTIAFSTSGDVAAFIAEPVLGEGGIIVPPAEYFARVANILRQHGILFIVDEVQTGFGRTGTMFAIEHSGVEPDLLTLGKAIANGFPLSALVARADIAAAFQPGDHLSTFGGNPVSCAAGLATIDFIQRRHLPAQAEEKGAYLLEQLRTLQTSCPAIGDVRGLGLMIGVEIVRGTDRRPDPQAARALQQGCRRAGVLIGLGGIYSNVLRLQPPLSISRLQLDQIVEALRRALRTQGLIRAPRIGGVRR